MKPPFDARAPSFDANAISETIQRALASAGLDTQTGPMLAVTQTIRRALGASLHSEGAGRFDGNSVIDVTAREVPAGGGSVKLPDRPSSLGKTDLRPGRFERREFANQAGTRAYWVYVPARWPTSTQVELRPLLVMLHGCTQSAADFAAGTQMNRLADQHGFLVVYPEQAAQANTSKCWNWFRPQDQQRDAGEPSLIADIVREVAQRHGADPRRIFVAGLSAGAAMALVLGQTYPDLFAGVGVHSGLPYGSAHDVPSALAAMKGGRSGIAGLMKAAGPDAARLQRAVHSVPVIVFHGDRDHTVQHSNAAQIVRQAQQAQGAAQGHGQLHENTLSGVALGGRRYTRTVHADAQGQTAIESWTLHGAGHAWAGGHAGGSYTDDSGPDASAEMVRFFLALPRAGSA